MLAISLLPVLPVACARILHSYRPWRSRQGRTRLTISQKAASSSAGPIVVALASILFLSIASIVSRLLAMSYCCAAGERDLMKGFVKELSMSADSTRFCLTTTEMALLPRRSSIATRKIADEHWSAAGADARSDTVIVWFAAWKFVVVYKSSG